MPITGLTALVTAVHTIDTVLNCAPPDKTIRYIISGIAAVVIVGAIKINKYCMGLKNEYNNHLEPERVVPEGLNRIVIK